MKTSLESSSLLPALIAGLCLTLPGHLTAQTFTTLYSFTATPVPPNYAPGINNNTNTDGAWPQAGLTLFGNTLYGAASFGGSSGIGTVFAVSADGTGFTNLHSFTGGGGHPVASMVLSGNTLYGTAEGDITFSHGFGGMFAVNTDGTGFTSFNSIGVAPQGTLVLSENIFYGTTYGGGDSYGGTVFKINIDGTSFTNLHRFPDLYPPFTNTDGAFPTAGLVLSGNTLYGTASAGGIPYYYAGPASPPEYSGTVFKVNTDGSGFTVLHNFTALAYDTNSDGVAPQAALVLLGNTLFGTATYGGLSGNGTVFKVNTDGTGFKNLHSFSGDTDGANPYAGLIVSGNSLYGTTPSGGSSGNGTVFKVNVDGTGFAALHKFSAGFVTYYTNGGVVLPTLTNSDGANPQGGLLLSGNTLYGTASRGGSSGNGTVFSLTLPGPPPPTLIRSGTDIVLMWPINAAGYTSPIHHEP